MSAALTLDATIDVVGQMSGHHPTWWTIVNGERCCQPGHSRRSVALDHSSRIVLGKPT